MSQCWLPCAILCLLLMPGRCLHTQIASLQPHSAAGATAEEERREAKSPPAQNQDANANADAALNHVMLACKVLQEQQAEFSAEWLQYRTEFFDWRRQQQQQHQQQQAWIQQQNALTKRIKRLFPATSRIGHALFAFTNKKTKDEKHPEDGEDADDATTKDLEEDEKAMYMKDSIQQDSREPKEADHMKDIVQQVAEDAEKKLVHSVIDAQGFAQQVEQSVKEAQYDGVKAAKDVHEAAQKKSKTISNIAKEAIGMIAIDAMETTVKEEQAAGRHITVRGRKTDSVFGAFNWGDYFLMSGLLLLLLLYLAKGTYGLFFYIWWCFDHAIYSIWHLGTGKETFSLLWLRELEYIHATIEEVGVRKSPLVMLSKHWDELSKGQKYVFRIIGFKEESWDDILTEMEDKELEFGEVVHTKWNDLNQFVRAMLMNIDLDESAWDMEYPEGLAIEDKVWKYLSDFEHSIARRLGVVHPDGHDWDDRTALFFRTEFDDLSRENRASLRQIGFSQESWKPHRDVKVPSFVGGLWFQYLNHSVRDIFIACYLIVQFLWFFWLLWKLGLVVLFLETYNILILLCVFILVLVFAVVRLLSPMAKRIQRHVVLQVRTFLPLVRDVWRLASNLNVHKAVQQVKQDVSKGITRCDAKCHRCLPCLPSKPHQVRQAPRRLSSGRVTMAANSYVAEHSVEGQLIQSASITARESGSQ